MTKYKMSRAHLTTQTHHGSQHYAWFLMLWYHGMLFIYKECETFYLALNNMEFYTN